MFHDGTCMVGMHAGWWPLWILLICLVLFAGWGRASSRCDRSRQTPREALRHRLAAGEITPPQYEEHKALLDRDAASPT